MQKKELNSTGTCPLQKRNINLPIRYHKVAKKTNILSLWFTNFRIRIFIFRNMYANATDHMTKSDLNSKFKMAAMIMTWFSQGIHLGIWQSRHQWNILKMPIKTWIAKKKHWKLLEKVTKHQNYDLLWDSKWPRNWAKNCTLKSLAQWPKIWENGGKPPKFPFF